MSRALQLAVPQMHTKVALSFDDVNPWHKEKERSLAAPLAVGGTVGGLLGLGGAAMAHKGLRVGGLSRLKMMLPEWKMLKGLSKRLPGPDNIAAERSTAAPEFAMEWGRNLIKHLEEQGIDPRTASIGIAGTGGTGKSSLAQALGELTGRSSDQIRYLDDYGRGIRYGRDLTGHIADSPVMPGQIVEQSHLLNQIDPDAFDVITRVERPYADIEKGILQRGRGAQQLDIYDYPKQQRVIQEAMGSTRGDAADLGGGLHVKVKPEGGFQADQILDEKLRAQGVDPKGLVRESKIHKSIDPKRFRTRGIWPYFKSDTFKNIGAGGVVGAGVGAGAAAGIPMLMDD